MNKEYESADGRMRAVVQGKGDVLIHSGSPRQMSVVTVIGDISYVAISNNGKWIAVVTDEKGCFMLHVHEKERTSWQERLRRQLKGIVKTIEWDETEMSNDPPRALTVRYPDEIASDQRFEMEDIVPPCVV